MTLNVAPGTSARARGGALLAALLVFAVLLVPAPASAATPTPTPSPTVTSAPLSGTAVVRLAPAANGILTPGLPFAATVELDNGTSSALAGGTATLTIGSAALTDAAALTAWLAGEGATPTGAVLAAADVPATGSGGTAAASLSAPADSPPLAGRAPGAYPLEVTVPSATGTLTARSVVVSPAAGAAPAGVVVPITAGRISTGLLTADALASLTGSGGALTALLDAVDGTTAILAIDPAIAAAIRALGTTAPTSATAWLTRLEDLPNSRFALQFGDADVTTQLAAGLSAPLQPDALTAYLSAANFVSAPSIATPAPTATPRSTPAPTATPRSTTALPATSDLLALSTTRDAVYWPPSGSATPDILSRLAALGTAGTTALTLVPSATTTPAPVRATAAGADLLVYDSGTSTALTSAAADPDAVSRGASLASATAYGALAVAGGVPMLAAIDRAAVADGVSQTALRAAISAVAGIPGTVSAALPTLVATPAAPVAIDHAAVDAARVNAATGLLADAGRVSGFATVLADPTLLTGPERATDLQLLGVSWIGAGPAWDDALAAHRDAVSATVSSVSIVPPSAITLLSADTGLRVWLRNDLPYPVDVVLHAVPDDPRIDVQRSTTVHIPASSNTPAEVPVTTRVGSGDVSVRLALASPSGQPVGAPLSIGVTVRAEWEGIGIIVLSVIVAVLLIGGVVRTILRRRRARTAPGADA